MKKLIDCLIRIFNADHQNDYVSYLSVDELRDRVRVLEGQLRETEEKLQSCKAGVPNLKGWNYVS